MTELESPAPRQRSGRAARAAARSGNGRRSGPAFIRREIPTFDLLSEEGLDLVEQHADRLLAETDCPYLAPQPVRGQTNEPAYVVHTLAALAAVTATAISARLTVTTGLPICARLVAALVVLMSGRGRRRRGGEGRNDVALAHRRCAFDAQLLGHVDEIGGAFLLDRFQKQPRRLLAEQAVDILQVLTEQPVETVAYMGCANQDGR